jgi:hypothetical protein
MVPPMKHAWMIILVSVACGGAQKVTITNQQEFENVVVAVIKDVIRVFNEDGINCSLLTTDLRNLRTGPNVTAAKEYVKAHPDAKQAVQPTIETHRADLDKASAPGVRQCGVTLQTVFNDISQ